MHVELVYIMRSERGTKEEASEAVVVVALFVGVFVA